MGNLDVGGSTLAITPTTALSISQVPARHRIAFIASLQPQPAPSAANGGASENLSQLIAPAEGNLSGAQQLAALADQLVQLNAP
jgi:hypothetical protein